MIKTIKAPPITEVTIRERILRNCEITKKESVSKGEVIIFGDRKFSMNRQFINLSDKDCEQIFNDPEIGMGAYIKQRENEMEKMVVIKKNRKATTSSLDPKPCECGCGEMARGGSKFRPGHDMKLKSALRKAVKAGDAKAKKELAIRGWV